MSDPLVTIDEFPSAFAADLARSHLELHGIEAICHGFGGVQDVGLGAGVLATIKLEVRKSDAEAAIAILKEARPDLMPDLRARDSGDMREAFVCFACAEIIPDDADACPACGWTWDDDGEADDEDVGPGC